MNIFVNQHNNMKRTFITMAAALLCFAACKKADVTPEKIVNYTVSCDYCKVTFTDNVNQVQSLVVRGQWVYNFGAGAIDTAKITTYVPAPLLPRPVAAVIHINGKEVARNETVSIGETVTTFYKVR